MSAIEMNGEVSYCLPLGEDDDVVLGDDLLDEVGRGEFVVIGMGSVVVLTILVMGLLILLLGSRGHAHQPVDEIGRFGRNVQRIPAQAIGGYFTQWAAGQLPIQFDECRVIG